MSICIMYQFFFMKNPGLPHESSYSKWLQSIPVSYTDQQEAEFSPTENVFVMAVCIDRWLLRSYWKTLTPSGQLKKWHHVHIERFLNVAALIWSLN